MVIFLKGDTRLSSQPDRIDLKGVLFAFSSYALWGFIPIYFKVVSHLAPFEVLCHRVIWSLLLLALLCTYKSGWYDLIRLMKRRKVALTVLLSTLCICTNWLVFIWAVTHQRVLEASLGYFINPLVSVALGYLFLGERMKRLPLISVVVATCGVLVQIVLLGILPWVSLLLAFSFGFYGLLRKTMPLGSIEGLLMETAYLFLPCVFYLLFFANGAPGGAFVEDFFPTGLILSFAGIVTATPLLLFASGARRIPLTAVGILQYTAPTLQFLVAIFLFGEDFSTGKAISFVIIWIALGIYTTHLLREFRRNRKR